MFRRPARAALLAGLVVSAVTLPAGCRHRPTAHCPTPAAAGLNTRDLADLPAEADAAEMIGLDRFTAASERLGTRLRDELLRDAPPGRPTRNVLCLSGGGSYGAFSAGVLIGWTERGDRPCFDVVTGVSTGALIAPFAFLGPRYDPEVRRFYTTVTDRDIFTKQYVRGLLGGESFTDTGPLRRLVGDLMTPQLLAEVAAAHRAGRRLVVGTTEEEGRRFVLWDIGAIACRNGPGDRELVIDVLMASASIPGVFPATKIDVTVDGVCRTERHIDGGTSQAAFFYPPYVPPDQRTPQALSLAGTDVYVIVAGKLYADPEVIKPSALTQAAKAVSTLIYAQTRGDLQRLWTYCLVNGMGFRVAAIPTEYADAGSSGTFDPKVMSGLFEEGRRMARSADPWRTTPPGTDPTQGEMPQVRAGRDLTFVPRGPQLPIAGPKGTKVPPAYPGVFPAGPPVVVQP